MVIVVIVVKVTMVMVLTSLVQRWSDPGGPSTNQIRWNVAVL